MYVKSEILIIDEALSTGDAYFVEKSKDKIKEFCNSGPTIIMVSHNFIKFLNYAIEPFYY